VTHPICNDVPSYETELVGALLLSDTSDAATAEDIDRAFETVRDLDFEDVVLRRIFAAERAAWLADRAIDIVRVRFESEAPTDVLSGVMARVPSAAILREASRRVALAGADRAERDAARRLATLGPAEATVARAELDYIAERREAIEGGEAGGAPEAEDAAVLLGDDAEPPAEELVERLITRPGVVIVYGASGSGKSYAVMAALLDLVGGGGTFCGAAGLQLRPRLEKFGDEPDRVLWVYGSEDPRRRIRARLRELWDSGPHAEKEFPVDRLLVASPGPRCLATPEGLAWLRREIGAARASVVVLDTVQSLTSANLDGSDGGAVSRWMGEMHRIRDRFSAVVIPVCHTSKTPSDAKSVRGKADALLGSQAWRSLADGMVMLDAPDGDASQGTLRIIKGKDVEDPIPPLKIGMDGASKRFRPLDEDEDGETVPLASAARVDARVGRPRAATAESVLALRDGSPEGLAWGAAWQRLGIGESTWKRLKGEIGRELAALGHVVRDGVLVWAERGARNGLEMGSQNEFRAPQAPRVSKSPTAPP